jgi:glycosyltransferase involved in cell wall biosynthesis
MQKKKVLVWETLATVSGGQKMTLTVMDMLSDKFEFYCLIPAEGMLSEELKKRNIPYTLMGNQTLPTGVKGKQVIFRYGWMSAKNVRKSLSVIRKYNPDILYAPGPAALPWSAICGTLSRKPVIWHLHHIFLDGATKKLLNLCGNWKSVRKIIAVSGCVGDQIVNEHAHEKVRVLYNPVDVEKYANGDAKKIIAELEAKLGRKLWRAKIVTQIGAITRNKRQDVLISVISNLKNLGEDIVGLIVGDTVTAADRIFRRELEQRIEDCGIQSQVLWMGFRSDIGNILAATDCVLVPSEEGLSLVAMEAMSAKRHVVTMNSSGAYELLNHAGCGTFYEGNNESSVIEAVKRVLEIPNAEELERGYAFCMKQTSANFKNKITYLFLNVQSSKGGLRV